MGNAIFAGWSLVSKVFFVAGVGLVGVFLVLCIFYLFLRFMQRWS